MNRKPRHKNRFSSAPRDLLDISYIVAVAEGTMPRHELAFPAFYGEIPQAEDYVTRENAYALGRFQGWHCELGGRFERPTPPKGMSRALLGAFAAGVLDGAESVAVVRRINAASARGSSSFDPFSDIEDYSAL